MQAIRALFLTSLAFICLAFADVNETNFVNVKKPFIVVTETNFNKLINGDSGLEFLMKTTIPIEKVGELKLGVSETYTAPRSSMLAFNHYGQRLDIGFFWYIFNDWYVGYTHSLRSKFAGANPDSVFMMDSVDIFSVRKEFSF